jgi:hypothetical protein
VLLVVVEYLGDRLHTGVLLALVIFSGALLVPVKDATDERRNQGHASLSTVISMVIGFGETQTMYLCTSNRLAESEQQGKVAVNALLFELPGGLDTFPCRRDLNKNTFLGGFFASQFFAI